MTPEVNAPICGSGERVEARGYSTMAREFKKGWNMLGEKVSKE
jgi:hypothetical protein